MNFFEDGFLSRADRIVCHNYDFDAPILGAEFLRYFHHNPIPTKAAHCTQKQSTSWAQIPYRQNGDRGNDRYKWPSLAELHAVCGFGDIEGAHDALVDVEATARCFFHIQNHSPAIFYAPYKFRTEMKLEIELVEIKGVGRLHQEHFTLRTESGTPLVEFGTTVPHGYPYIKVHAGQHAGKAFSVKGTDFAQSLYDLFVKTADERTCRICGCTEDDCHQCIEKTGAPCHWVEHDLCSACTMTPMTQ